MENKRLEYYFAAFIFTLSLVHASFVSDVGVNVSIGQSPVLLINNFFINPEDIPIGNAANFSINVSNIGNVNGNASSLIQIYDGYNVIDSFESQIFVVPYQVPNNYIFVSTIRYIDYSIGSYTALGYIKYNNKTIGPILKNFTINRGLAPSIYLVSPLNNSWTHLSNDQLNFVFYVDDVDSTQFRCELYLDGQKVGENISVTKSVNTSIKSNVSFSSGVHQWYVKCFDNGNNSAFSSTWRLNTGSFCSNLNIDNLSYSIKQDLYSNETCFTITGNNVTLDCEGNSIFFTSGSAIVVDGQSASIKNCNIIQNGTLAANGIEIKQNASNLSISNNNVRLLGNNSIGLKFLAGYAKLINNSILVQGDSSIALYLENSTFNTISNNTFEASYSSTFIQSDLVSNQNTFLNNVYTYPLDFEGFRISIYVNQSGLNTTLPSVGRTPELFILIPENSVDETTQLNITTKYGNIAEVPINIASNKGNLMMTINVSTSRYLSTNESNPYSFTVNMSKFNLSDSEKSRFGLYFFNDSSSRWESVATQCNITSGLCTGYLTHFSTYGWIVYQSQILNVTVTVSGEKETRAVPLSGMLSCTKELAKILTEPDAVVEVRFLEQPYSNSLIKRGNTDENGSFTFIADLPGRYQISVRKQGFKDNVITLTASDECIPRITFVRRWLECSLQSCSINIPVLTTQMKNVIVDLKDVYPIMSGSLTIKDKYGAPISYYTLVRDEIRFPLITDSFTINSQSKVNLRQINDLKNGKVNLSFTNVETARVSGFVLNIGDIGNNYINNITYIADKEYPIFRYTVEGNKITIDQQLYLYPNSKFVLSVSPVPLRCSSNLECPSDSTCKGGTCVVIHCPCGYILNRTCIPYECCVDSDCPSGKGCISHLCVYTPPSISEEEKRYIADRLNVLIVSIQSARGEGEDVTAASQLLEQARTAYEAGDFEKAKELLAQAQQIFTVEAETKPQIPTIAIITIVVIALVLVFAYLVISRLSKPWRGRKK